MKTSAIRYHDFCTGHRVVGHENKCRYLHGHNYRVYFHCSAEHLDSIGRVIDFSIIKGLLCEWLEDNWDHKFLAWRDDKLLRAMDSAAENIISTDMTNLFNSIVWLPFNPTAENMASYLLNIIGPLQLKGSEVTLVKVVIEETRKCSVECSLE